MTERRYDLDWMRIIAFGLLILYHVGMVYVAEWGYHYKSAYQSSWLANLMLLVNPWRMALLWMVSGIASAYLLQKSGWVAFLASRSHRLLLPLLFGVWVIVPPQLFVEMSAHGDFVGSYASFYREFLDLNSTAFGGYTSGIWPHVDVNHLWYLRELWLFTLLMVIALPALHWIRRKRLVVGLITSGSGIGLLLALPLLLGTAEALWFSELDSEARRKVMGFTFLLLGYLLAFEKSFFEACARWRRIALAAAVASYMTYLVIYHWVWIPGDGEVSGLWGLRILILDQLDRWLWLCAGFGYAYYYLNRPHPWLAYLSAGVFPYYIVHQTIIVVSAFVIGKLAVGGLLEPMLVAVFTITGCWLFHEVGRRAGIFSPLFGLKWAAQSASSSISRQVTRGCALAGVFVIALAVLL